MDHGLNHREKSGDLSRGRFFHGFPLIFARLENLLVRSGLAIAGHPIVRGNGVNHRTQSLELAEPTW